MRPFETTDVAFLETLRTRHEALKAKLAAAKRAQDAQHAAEIDAELREMVDKASCGASSNCRPAGHAHGRACAPLVARLAG